jgi:hypothetical protein
VSLLPAGLHACVEHTRLGCKDSYVVALLARAELNWSNLHAGPDFAKASSWLAAFAPVRRDAHADVEKLTTGSILARFHFFNFEESVL